MNIALLLTMAADALADRCAISDGGRNLGYDDLRDGAAAFAASLPDAAGTLVYAGPINAATPIALFGSAWAGRSFAPLNHRLPEPSLVRLARGLAPAHAVTSADHLHALAAVLPGAQRDDELLAGGAGPQSNEPIESPDRPAVLLYTSGTSAAPKAAALGHENLLAYIWNTVELAASGDDEAALIAVPSFHIAGIAALLSNVYAGRRVVTTPAFDAEAWLHLARDEQVTHAFLVPTMLARIVEVMQRRPELRVPSLRVLSYGGARMPLPVLEEALGLFTATDFVNAYGLTETSSTVALLSPEDHRRARDGDEIARRRLASVGRPIPGIEIEVVDDTGRTVPVQMEGRLRIRGSQVSGTYLDGTAAMGADGWLLTGDRGRIDPDGYVWVLGREDDVLIRGGENITPAEVEDALLRHPDISQAAVVGLPDPAWGEQIAAVVVVHPRRALSVEEVREHVQAMIGSFKTPATVVFVADLPMTASGKLVRRAVREQLLARVAIPESGRRAQAASPAE